MNPARPEDLLSLLLDSFPSGVPRRDAADSLWQELLRRGYGLSGDTTPALNSDQWFHPARFEQQRRGTWGSRLHTWGVVQSTNDLAHQADAQGAGPGVVWVADEQRAGRGRQGRSWLAPRFSSLLFSVQLPVVLRGAAQPQLLPLALGVALCESLEVLSGLPLQVKWPNDIVWNGCKLGGMLLEARQSPQRTILGVGVNVHLDAQRLQELGVPRSTGLCDAPSLRSKLSARGFREGLLASLLAGIEPRLGDWQGGRFESILGAWRQRDALDGRRVRAATAQQVVEGNVVGISEDGLLQLHDAHGRLHSFSAAEVHLL